eukprot:2676267-Rhodomonas_salina.2
MMMMQLLFETRVCQSRRDLCLLLRASLLIIIISLWRVGSEPWRIKPTPTTIMTGCGSSRFLWGEPIADQSHASLESWKAEALFSLHEAALAEENARRNTLLPAHTLVAHPLLPTDATERKSGRQRERERASEGGREGGRETD